VPAENFEQSLAFYAALGWSTLWSDGKGLALMSLGGSQMMLQDYYVKDWAENSMLVVEVADAFAWYRHVERVLLEGNFGSARIAEPRNRSGARL
jgi:hypothetical protein